MNLYDYLLENAPSDKTAILSRHERVTYSELIADAESAAAALVQLGVGKGDRVALLADNSAFWVACYLGCLKIGAVAVPLPARLTVEAFTAFLDAIHYAAFCADAGRFARYRAALPPQNQVVLPSGTNLPEAPLIAAEMVRGATCPTVTIDERDDLAALMFTSGSTGQPNAVKVSHRNIMANTDAIIDAVGITPDDVMLTVMPFDYCFGTSLLHTHLRVGATLALSSFTFPETALDDMEHYGCTSIAGVPTIYQQLLRRSTLKQRDMPQFRSAQQAGGKLPNTLIAEFTTAFPQVRLCVMYGQTEATARLSVLPPERLRDKPGSVGRAIPGVTLRIVDEGGNAVMAGDAGEIVAEGDNVALGYWLPDAAQRFRDGKLYTGDLGYVDDEGFLYITGRTSDFLKLRGHRVSSREIEDALYELSDVLEATVVGVQRGDAGEVAKAYLVVQPESALTAQQVIAHCKRRMPPYAVPGEVVFLAELPKNAAGKIMKSAL